MTRMARMAKVSMGATNATAGQPIHKIFEHITLQSTNIYYNYSTSVMCGPRSLPNSSTAPTESGAEDPMVLPQGRPNGPDPPPRKTGRAGLPQSRELMETLRKEIRGQLTRIDPNRVSRVANVTPTPIRRGASPSHSDAPLSNCHRHALRGRANLASLPHRWYC
jgi:hypothetical protein